MIVQIRSVIGTCICLFLWQVIEIKGLPETKNATATAIQKCEEYAEYRNVKKWIPAMASKPGYWYNTTDCVNVVPLIVGGTQTKPKEYPHMARIGFAKDDDIKNVEWICGGSLISEKFILSTAVCGEGTSLLKPHWVLLGDLDLHSTSDDARPAIYDIVRVHYHPNYKSPSSAYDISLFELNTNVAMSPYIRPACLYTSTSDLANTRGSITGWGITALGEKKSMATDKLFCLHE
ncbi:trypsin [Sarracenia purpurea var. burkii]